MILVHHGVTQGSSVSVAISTPCWREIKKRNNSCLRKKEVMPMLTLNPHLEKLVTFDHTEDQCLHDI